MSKKYLVSLWLTNIENEQTTYTHRFGRARKMRKMRMNDKIEHTHVRNIQAKRHTKKNVQSWQKKNHQQNFLNLRDFKIKKNNACQRKTWFCYFIYETDTIILFFFRFVKDSIKYEKWKRETTKMKMIKAKWKNTEKMKWEKDE